jgi:hypothetical protein
MVITIPLKKNRKLKLKKPNKINSLNPDRDEPWGYTNPSP